MYFGANSSSSRYPLSDVLLLHGAARQGPVEACVPHLGEHARHRGAARNTERDDVVTVQGHHAQVEAHEPVERLAEVASARQPEPGELHRGARAELARAHAVRCGPGEPRGERSAGRAPAPGWP